MDYTKTTKKVNFLHLKFQTKFLLLFFHAISKLSKLHDNLWVVIVAHRSNCKSQGETEPCPIIDSTLCTCAACSWRLSLKVTSVSREDECRVNPTVLSFSLTHTQLSFFLYLNQLVKGITSLQCGNAVF